MKIIASIRESTIVEESFTHLELRSHALPRAQASRHMQRAASRRCGRAGCHRWLRLVCSHPSGRVPIARVWPQQRLRSAAFETGCRFAAAKVAVDEPETPPNLSSARGNMTSETKMLYLRRKAGKCRAPETFEARLADDGGPPGAAEVAATVHSFALPYRVNRLSTSPPNRGRHRAGTPFSPAVE